MAAKGAIFSNNVPGGPQNIVDIAKHPDEVFFVNSATGSDAAGYGNSPGVPVASINYAVTLATANKNTIIYVMPGHDETDDVTVNIAGVHIIGLGKGSDRPTMTYSAVDTTWTISAANVTIENILFVTAIDSVVTFGTISGADCTMINCEWRDTTDIEVITDWTVTGDRPKFINCFKNGYTSGNANVRCISLAGVDGAYIYNCRFVTKVTTAVIGFVTTACTNVIIDDCTFLVSGTTDYSKNAVDTITGSTWLVNKGFDIGAGAKFSGGSGGALAGDDVGAVASAVATVDTVVDAIKAVTDNLPNSGALTDLATAAALTTVDTIVDAIKAVTDNLPNSGALTDLATAAALTTVDTVVDGIATDLGDYSGRTNLQTKLAVDGNPDVAGATTWSALVGSNVAYKALKGLKVTRAKADVLDSVQNALFTIANGRILLLGLQGEVCDGDVDNESADTKFIFNPTVGADSDMCAVGALDAAPVGTVMSITGLPTDAMLFDTGMVPWMARPLELAEGTIDIQSEADNGADNSATVSFELWYMPLDTGATITST